MATAESKLSMKLLIDTKAKKVLFAEADSNCVDFLFSILSLPVGTVVRLLRDKGINCCCLPNLYQSIENLNENYIQSNQNKDIFLKPKSSTGISSVPFLLTNNDVTPTEKSLYKCSYYNCSLARTHVTDDPSVLCPGCRNSMSTQLTYVGTSGVGKEVLASTNKGGFVKELVTYMVLDDLVVKPMSPISSIALLNKFNVKDVSVLQEVEVNFGMEEALELLKASFESKGRVLTTVLMRHIKVEN